MLETELYTFAVIPISFEAGPTAKSEHSYISPSQSGTWKELWIVLSFEDSVDRASL